MAQKFKLKNGPFEKVIGWGGGRGWSSKNFLTVVLVVQDFMA